MEPARKAALLQYRQSLVRDPLTDLSKNQVKIFNLFRF